MAADGGIVPKFEYNFINRLRNPKWFGLFGKRMEEIGEYEFRYYWDVEDEVQLYVRSNKWLWTGWEIKFKTKWNAIATTK